MKDLRKNMHAAEARDSHKFALLKYGSQWVSVNGGMFNVRIFGATGDGSTGIRIFMGGSGMIEGTVVKGNIISASENGILLQGTNVSRALVGDRDPDEFHGRCSFNLAPGTLQVDVWQHTDYALNLNSGVGGQAPLPTTKIQSIKFI